MIHGLDYQNADSITKARITRSVNSYVDSIIEKEFAHVSEDTRKIARSSFLALYDSKTALETLAYHEIHGSPLDEETVRKYRSITKGVVKTLHRMLS